MRKVYQTPQGGPTEIAAVMPHCAGRNGAHTPGPWSAVADPAVYDSLTDIMDVEGNYIAFTSGADLPTMEANARLIAAAPDLLAELEVREGDLVMLKRAIEEGDPKAELLVRVSDMLRETRAAIASATGAA